MPPSGLIPCSECARHVRIDEATCPHCGAAVPARSGKAARTAAAVALGIGVASAAGSACGTSQDEYGAPIDDGGTTTSAGGEGGAGGDMGSGGDPGAGGTGG